MAIPDMVITSNAWQVAEQIGVFETLMVPVMMTSMSQSLDVLQYAMVNSMYRLFEFKRAPSTGVLENGFFQLVLPYPALGYVEGQLGNDVDYAWRRQEGFDLMTDSLGRFYIEDPHFRGSLDYMGRGLRNTQTRKRIRELFQEGLAVALVGMGVTP